LRRFFFYLVFHGRRHPRHLGAPEVEQFLTHLAVHRKVSAATQNQALQALLFLYATCCRSNCRGSTKHHPSVHTRRRRPVVLSRAEVRSLLSQLQGAPWLVANLLYGSGLRLMEALRLRVKDLALERGELIVRETKGGKDRVTVLPAVLDPPLRGISRGCCSATLTSRPRWSTCMSWGRARTACAAPRPGRRVVGILSGPGRVFVEPANRFCRHAS